MNRAEEISLVQQVTVFHDQRAFGKLMREYQSPVRRFLLSQTLGDSQLSDDLAQDTFVKAYTHIDQFQGKSSFLTWLFRIAYNVFYDYVRGRKSTLDLETTAVRGKCSERIDSTLRMDIYEALQLLNHSERVCITLQLMEGQPIDKISAITEIPENTVKSHLARGKKKMANFLRANGYG
ncbi:RNA polymerase sigma factor [Hallella colorans]|uniref:RNA polymerase sigma factor n=1 Tax=Hallella colorans TaxID=1703337 RepID=A0A2U0TWF3_9BACT|nr:RNA polymerase sigma factor [Hallella colorans]PVX47926.1 RNA polymerase sigma-70 factor (ECF subfamily) [Hallella colorans]